MNTAKHTPGPWVLNQRRRTFGQTNLEITSPDGTEDGFEICTIPTHEGMSRNATLEANARLIAAAPDMLQALIHTYQWQKNKGFDLEWILEVIRKADPDYQPTTR